MTYLAYHFVNKIRDETQLQIPAMQLTVHVDLNLRSYLMRFVYDITV